MKRNRGKMILCTALACLCMTSLFPIFSEAASNTATNAPQDKVAKVQHHIMKKKINGITYPDRNPNTKRKSNGIAYPDKAPKTKQKSNGIAYPDKAPKTKQKSNGIAYPDKAPKTKQKSNGIAYPDRNPNTKRKSNGIAYPDKSPKTQEKFVIADEIEAEDYLLEMLSGIKGFNFKKYEIVPEELEIFPAASNHMEWYFGYGAKTKGDFYPERFFAVTEYGDIFEYDEIEDDWFTLAVPY